MPAWWCDDCGLRMRFVVRVGRGRGLGESRGYQWHDVTWHVALGVVRWRCSVTKRCMYETFDWSLSSNSFKEQTAIFNLFICRYEDYEIADVLCEAVICLNHASPSYRFFRVEVFSHMSSGWKNYWNALFWTHIFLYIIYSILVFYQQYVI